MGPGRSPLSEDPSQPLQDTRRSEKAGLGHTKTKGEELRTREGEEGTCCPWSWGLGLPPPPACSLTFERRSHGPVHPGHPPQQLQAAPASGKRGQGPRAAFPDLTQEGLGMGHPSS